MAKQITLLGSTGLIGQAFLNLMSAEDGLEVTAITRREMPGFEGKGFIHQAIHDFKDLESIRPDLKTDVLVCTLGTTIKTAGSRERFFEVDHDIPLRLAQIAFEEGCRNMILVSSVGADAASRVFYSRVKGQLEEDLKPIGFDQLHILRPSMLLGDRQEHRPGEFIGKLISKPLTPIIPWRYKPIHAKQVAAKIRSLVHSHETAVHIWEGKLLFQLN